MKRIIYLSLLLSLNYNAAFGQTTTQTYQYVGSELQYTYTATHNSAIAHSNPASTKVTVSGLPSGYYLKEVILTLGDGGIYSGSLSNTNGKLEIKVKDPNSNISDISKNVSFSNGELKSLTLAFRNNSHLKTLSVSADNRGIDQDERLYGIFKSNTAWSMSPSNGDWFILTTLASNTSYPRKIKSVVLIFGNTDNSQVITAGVNCNSAKEIQNNILYKTTNSGCETNQSHYPLLDGPSNWNGARNTTAWFYFIATNTTAKIRLSSINPQKMMQSMVAHTNNGSCSTNGSTYTLKPSTRHGGNTNVRTRFNYDYVFADLIVGKKYFLLVDGDGSSGQIGDISEFTILLEMTRITSLPINLLEFSAKEDKGHIALNWSTASERNNDYFTISRSSDLQNWEEVGTVNGNGTVNHKLDYEFIDIAPLEGVSYYQLKQTDYNGENESFDPVSVEVSGNTLSNAVLVYPNPTKAGFDVQVYATNANNATITIHSVSGKQVLEQSVGVEKGKNVIPVKNEKLDPGVYLVKVQFADGTNCLTKLIVE